MLVQLKLTLMLLLLLDFSTLGFFHGGANEKVTDQLNIGDVKIKPTDILLKLKIKWSILD